MQKDKIGIIDIGSNSIRTVIFGNQHGTYEEVYNFKVVARLSSHIDHNNELTQKGMKILILTLKRFQKILQYHDVNDITAVATAAIRNASNQQEIIEQLSFHNLFNVRVLSDFEEAYYGYLAVISSTDIKNGVTIDIGGGSTEITLFENGKLCDFHSFPFGAITLKNQFMKTEQLTLNEKSSLSHYLHNEFNSLAWVRNQKKPIIGIGGSARNLSLIHQRQTNYPLAGLHQYKISAVDLNDLNEMIQSSTYAERLQIDGLSKERADIIVPASQAIQTLMNVSNSPLFIMSNKGLRDGVLMEKLKKNDEDVHYIAEHSINQLAKRFQMNETHITQVAMLARKLRTEIQPFIAENQNIEEDLELLQYSAKLFSIGEFINEEASSEHTFYLLTNMTIDGLSHEQRIAIAFIASFKSRARLYRYWDVMDQSLSQLQLNRLEILGAILKLAFNLNRTRQNVIKDIIVTKTGPKTLILQLANVQDAYFEEQYAGKHKKHLERALGCKIEIHLKDCN